jgi:hypothetical protein
MMEIVNGTDTSILYWLGGALIWAGLAGLIWAFIAAAVRKDNR